MSDEKTVIQKLDTLRDEVAANHRTTERAFSAVTERIVALEQWRSSTDDTFKRVLNDELPYMRDKLDSIDEKVDGNRVTIAKWAGFGAAILFAFEVVSKWL